MFATGSHDGGVRIWTRLDDDEPPDPASSLVALGNLPFGLGPSRSARMGGMGRTFALPGMWDTVRSVSPGSRDEKERDEDDVDSMRSTRGGSSNRGDEEDGSQEKGRGRQKARNMSWSSSGSSR